MGQSWTWPRQRLAYGGLALGLAGLTALLGPSCGACFHPYVGDIPPVGAVLAASTIGAVALWVLKARGGFEVIRGRATLRGLPRAVGLATAFACAIVLADLLAPYPEDTNVGWPQAAGFYPVMGWVAEVVFHVLPLAVLWVALAPLGRRFGRAVSAWVCIGLVAALEPAFQLAFAADPVTWASGYMAVHVFAISVVGLSLFRRYDFATMYAFRLVYYSLWHVAWGVLRLDLLF